MTADDGRRIGSDEIVVTVANVAPTATLSSSGPISEGAFATIAFADEADPSPADTAAGFRYAFHCDGSPFEPTPSYVEASTQRSTSCQFNEKGSKTVRGRILDKDGGFREYTTDVTVTNAAPTVAAAPDQSADEGSATGFELGSFIDAGGDDGPWTVDVDWGDGSAHTVLSRILPGTLGTTGHAYADGPAAYTVSVTVTDSRGASDTDSFDVTVENLAPAVTPASDQAAQTGTTASIDIGSVTDPNPGDGPWTVAVDWGDGSPSTTFEVTTTGPLGTRDHTYLRDGEHAVRVSVTDKDGATGTARAFTVASTPAAATLTVVLDATPTSPQDFSFTIAGDAGEPAREFVLDDDDDPGHLAERVFDVTGDGLGRTTVTGPEVPGWTLSAADLRCEGDNGDPTADPAERRVQVNVDPGERITCYFSYLRDATVTVVEHADPDSSQTFDFATTGSRMSDFSLRDDGTATSEPPPRRSFTVSAGGFGPKTITQAPARFWALDELSCTGDPDSTSVPTERRLELIVDPGEDVVCTFRNRRVASTVGGVFPESSSDIGPIVDGNGNLYTVTELAALDPRPCLRKSTDGGRSWTEVDGANRPSNDDLESVSLVKDRENPYRVHLLMQRSGTNRVSYNSFNMSDAPSAPDAWQTKNEIVAIPGSNPDEAPVDQYVSLVQRPDGDLIAFYATSRTVPGPNGLEQVGFKSKSGGAWGPEQLLVPSPTASHTQAVAVMGDGDVTHVFYKNQTTQRIWYRTLNPNGTLGVPKELTDYGTQSSRHIIATPVAHLHVVRPSDGQIVERFVVGWKRSTGGTLNAAVVDDGVVGPETQVSDVPVLSNPASTQSAQAVAGFVADDAGDRVYAVYSDDAMYDLHHDVLPAGGTWGTDVKALGGYEVMAIQPTVFTHRPADGGARVLGVLFDDNVGFETLGLDNVPRYTDIPLG